MKFRLVIALAAVLAAVAASAQEDEPSSDGVENASAEPAQEKSEEGAEAAVEGLPEIKKPRQQVFSVLPVCRNVTGRAQVRKPRSEDWEQAVEGRRYPLGSSFRTLKGATLTVVFGRNCQVKAEGEAAFGTRSQPLGVESRTLVLESGAVRVSLPENLKPGLFVVAAPGFTIRNPAGESTYQYRTTGDGDEAVLRCITGSFLVEGRHFTVPQMRVSNQFRIRSSHDNLASILYGEAGDFIVSLDRGIVERTKIDEEGNVTRVTEPDHLDWHLSPETRVQINRAVPAIGERLSVTVMTFDSKGELKNLYAFAEGCTNVNTGELAKSAQDAKQAELAKKAAEATGAAEGDAKDGEGEKASENNNEENESDKESEEEEE